MSLALLVSPVVAEQIDNCASMLGSISVELRVARALPPFRQTTFTCPKDTNALLGASKQRILNSLGTPDAIGYAEDGVGASSWSYFFASKLSEPGQRGVPELTFSFDGQQMVNRIHCQRTH
jgi:hypothetical protein